MDQKFPYQINFNVTHMNEHEYFNDFPRVADLSVFDGARFSMYLSDNFYNVKKCYHMHNDDKTVNIMGGFFVIDGKILEPSRESETFEDLQIDQESEIVLVTWCDHQVNDDDDWDDTWEQLYQY